MELAPVTSNIGTQAKANAAIRSAYVRTPDFSQYIKTNKTNQTMAVSGVDIDMKEQADIDQAATDMWGTAYNPATHSVQLDQLAANTQSQTDAFARKLGDLLRSQGVDTSIPISLNMTQAGYVQVTSNHPDKAKIENYFADNPALANQYYQVSNNNDLVASGKLADVYGKQWSAAKEAGQKQNVFTYYSSLIDQAKRLNGQMTLSRDSLSSASLSYAAKIVGKS